MAGLDDVDAAHRAGGGRRSHYASQRAGRADGARRRRLRPRRRHVRRRRAAQDGRRLRDPRRARGHRAPRRHRLRRGRVRPRRTALGDALVRARPRGSGRTRPRSPGCARSASRPRRRSRPTPRRRSRCCCPTLQTEVRLTRAEFETMIRPALGDDGRRAAPGAARRPASPPRRSTRCCSSAARRASRWSPQMVSAPSSAGRSPVDAHPKHAVALGAAIAAAAASGSRDVGVGDHVAPVDMIETEEVSPTASIGSEAAWMPPTPVVPTPVVPPPVRRLGFRRLRFRQLRRRRNPLRHEHAAAAC